MLVERPRAAYIARHRSTMDSCAGEVTGEARGREGTHERVQTVRGSSPRLEEGREGAGKAPESSRV